MITISILATGKTAKARDQARGHLFERMISEVLGRVGHKVEETNASRSGGEIDIVCRSVIGRVPGISECKARNRPVSVSDLKKFKATYDDHLRRDAATIGIMVSLGGFGSDALEYYQREIKPHFPHFEMYDADRVYELLVAAGIVATQQEVSRLISARTNLTCDSPTLVYAHSEYFWLVNVKASHDHTFGRFLLTDSRGMLPRDPVRVPQLTEFIVSDIAPKATCVNDAFPEPHHRAVVSEAGRYYGLRGQYQFPAQETLRQVLKKKQPELWRTLESFLQRANSCLQHTRDAEVWRIHCEETERLLGAMIPDEVKEDMFPTEVGLLIGAAWHHAVADVRWLVGAPEAAAYGQRLVALLHDTLPAYLGQLLTEVADRVHTPFARTGQTVVEGLEKIDLDFATACMKLACSLDLAFFRASPAVYSAIEARDQVPEKTFKALQCRGLLLDYNEHRVSVHVTSYTPEAHLAVLALTDWLQSILDDIEPILYARGIRFLRADAQVERIGYEMVGCRFEAHTESIVKLLMGRALYGTEDVAVRELVQNALDAVFTQGLVRRHGYRPLVSVRVFGRAGTDYLEVEDNGCGMDRYIVQKYLSAIGKSFWRSEDFRALTRAQAVRPGTVPAGQFGIGILSAFMLGDQMEIHTRMERSPAVYIGIPGVRDYFVVRESHRAQRGTRVTLRLKTNVEVKAVLEKYIVRPRCPVEFVIEGERALTIDRRPERLWPRLGVPDDLSGTGPYFGFPVSVKGDGFEGEIMVVLPGNKARVHGGGVRALLDRLAKKRTRETVPGQHNAHDREDVWQVFPGRFALLQSGVLVKETEREKDRYRIERTKAVGIEPAWTRSASGYLDCLPGVLELTVSRTDVVDGKIPDSCRESIAAAGTEGLESLKRRCETIWQSVGAPGERERDLINATIEAFEAVGFGASTAWEELVVNRYSLVGVRVRGGSAKPFFATARELTEALVTPATKVFAVGEGALQEWWGFLARLPIEEEDVVYFVGRRFTTGAVVKFLGCRDVTDHYEWEQFVSEMIDVEEEAGELQQLVPGYCGLCRFKRPAFSGFVLIWSGARGWCVQRADAADVSRFDFLKDTSISPTLRSRMPKVMFNADHPLCNLLRRLAVGTAADAVREQLRSLLLAAVRFAEAHGQRQRKALFDEFAVQMNATMQHARALQVIQEGDREYSVTQDDFVVR